MKKQLYEEQYNTYMFLLKVDFFTSIAYNPDDKEELQLYEKLEKITKKNKLHNTENMGFLVVDTMQENMAQFSQI